MPRGKNEKAKAPEAEAEEQPAVDEKALAKAKAEQDLAFHASAYVERHPSVLGVAEQCTPFSEPVATLRIYRAIT